MNFFTKSTSTSTRPKPAPDLVRSFLDSALKLSSSEAPQDAKRCNEEIVKSLRGMKAILSDASPSQSSSNIAGAPTTDQGTELSSLIFQSSLLRILLQAMPRMEFEAKKEGAAVFGLLLRRQVGTRWPAVEYMGRERELITLALKG